MFVCLFRFVYKFFFKNDKRIVEQKCFVSVQKKVKRNIKEKALFYTYGYSSVEEIDKLNILNATMLAMSRAIKKCPVNPDYCLIDGNLLPESLECRGEAVVKGDLLVAEISAASILAKVARDQEMRELDQQFPQYEFAKHKGYPTKLHLQKLAELGALPQHRCSFAPVRKLLRDI